MEGFNSPAGGKPAPGAPPSRRLAPAALINQFDLRQAMVVIRSHLLIAVAIALVVCTVIGWQQMRRPRLYSAAATLALERRDRVIDLKRSDDAGFGSEFYLATRIGELRSAEVVEYVVKSLTPEESAQVLAPYANGRPQNESTLAAIVRSSATTEREPGTLLASIVVKHRDPDAAALLANRYAEQFIRYLFDKSSASNNAGLVFLREQAEDLRKKLEDSERSLQEYRGRYNLVSLDESQNIVVDRLKSLNSSATAARVRRAEIEVRLKQAETALAEKRDPVELSALSGSSALADAQHRIDDLKAKRAVLAERYGRRHPAMQEITRTLEALQRLRDEEIATTLNSLRSQRDKAVSEEQELQAQLAAAEAEALRLDQIGVEYGVLRRAIETQKTIYTQILSRLNEASISAQLESVNVRIADRAQPNRVPISPNLRKTTLILSLLALGILLGYPFAVELLFARVRSGSDIEYYLGSPLLGEISSVRSVPEKDRPHLVRHESEEPVAEQFRALFSHLQLVSKIDPPKAILITSTVPSEGKSFIASNLAAAFVSHGKRTLLIDADLRRPSQHRTYDVDNHAGLLRWIDEGATVLENPEQDERLGIVEIAPNHYLLRAGGSSRRASEIVGSGRLNALVTALQRRFDVLIFDAPPAGVFSDAISFAQFCNEFVFVCRFGVASRQQVRNVLERLRQTGLDFPGIVLNALPAGRGTGYYYYHGYGSSRRYAKYYSRKDKE